MAQVYALKYLAKAAASVPRDLVNTFVSDKLHPIRPTVLIYNCTWVCDARCTMCSNWKRGNRKEDMTLAEIDRVMDDPFWHAVENLNISGGEPTTRNDLLEVASRFSIPGTADAIANVNAALAEWPRLAGEAGVGQGEAARIRGLHARL